MPVLSSTMAMVAAAAVVLAVLLLWKMVKLAFKVGLVVVAGVAIFLLARQAGWL